MFKSISLFKIGPDFSPTLQEMEEGLATRTFTPTGPTQLESYGWIGPRGQANGALAESVGGQRIVKLCIETRSVPGAAVAKLAGEKAKLMEEQMGFKPGRKAMRELKDEARLTLLPHAFPRLSAVNLWFDLENRWLISDASSSAGNDRAITALVEALPGLSVRPIMTTMSPASAMSVWLSAENEQDWPGQFSVGRECELRSNDESKSVLKFSRHSIFNEEIRAHVAQGKRPVKLAMNWDGRVNFVLTEALQLKKIELLDVAIDAAGQQDDAFDADVALITGELRNMLPDLIRALCGEFEPTKASEASEISDPTTDPDLQKAIELVTGPGGKASISFVQRHLRLSYNHAAKLLETMEQQGIVTPADEHGVRQISQAAAAA